MNAIWDSFLLVLASEMGDKTQLLALVLVARYKKPWTVMLGILIATLLNHGLASWTGGWIGAHVPESYLRIGLALIFLAFGAWLLVPDKDEGLTYTNKYGAFVTTTTAFFFAEMGDKTQLATIALGARFTDVMAVTVGSTAGMLAANGLAVGFGEKLTERISMKWIRRLACALFVVFGVAIYLEWV